MAFKPESAPRIIDEEKKPQEETHEVFPTLEAQEQIHPNKSLEEKPNLSELLNEKDPEVLEQAQELSEAGSNLRSQLDELGLKNIPVTDLMIASALNGNDYTTRYGENYENELIIRHKKDGSGTYDIITRKDLDLAA